MLRIVKNSNTFENVLDTVLKGIKDPILINKIEINKANLIKEFESYEEHTTNGDGYKINKYHFSKKMGIDPFVVGNLKHSELRSLYSKYFVPKGLSSRVIYNKILASSTEGCPYCGGIGSVKELDHFLPKSKYPQFSLLTSNLVPSCKICNQDLKGTRFAKLYEEQIIHPYNDINIFFEDKWIDVVFTPNDNKELEFFVSPPDWWSEDDKKRATLHFEVFDLAERYSTFISGEYLSIKQSIENLKPDYDNKRIVEYLIQHVLDGVKNPNDCRRILYEAFKRELLQPLSISNIPTDITCPRCNGDQNLSTGCNVCKGMGTVKKTRDIESFDPFECPNCNIFDIDPNCNICNGKVTISSEKAKDIGV